MTSRGFAEFVFENLGQEYLEAVYYNDGDTRLRARGSTGNDEDSVVVTVPLSWAYWSDSWIFDVLYEWKPEAERFGRVEVLADWLERDIIHTIGDEVFGYWI